MGIFESRVKSIEIMCQSCKNNNVFYAISGDAHFEQIVKSDIYTCKTCNVVLDSKSLKISDIKYDFNANLLSGVSLRVLGKELVSLSPENGQIYIRTDNLFTSGFRGTVVLHILPDLTLVWHYLNGRISGPFFKGTDKVRLGPRQAIEEPTEIPQLRPEPEPEITVSDNGVPGWTEVSSPLPSDLSEELMRNISRERSRRRE